MPYRFTKEDIVPGAIVQSREFDNALGNYVDVMNGGMDRDNMPYAGVGSASCKGSLFQQIKIVTNINPPDSELQPDANYVTPTPNRLGRLMYGYRFAEEPINSGDGWGLATTQTFDCNEGMLEISWQCAEAKTQYWSYWKNFSTDKVALKYMQWQIRVDGNQVYTGCAQYEIMNTSIHRCTIPISKGEHEISIHWRVPSQRDDDDQDQVVAVWWGGLFTAINKYR
tara:strand:- start:2989 stop:3663 length:675 start_codon:yes stop_codon:yes gene_type:complete